MSKCPNCNVDMKEIDGQIYLCPKCGGKFRKKQPTSQVPPTGLASTAPQVSQTACSQNMNEESNAATKQQAVGADKENGSKDDEIELLKQRLAAMEAQQRQLADKIGPEHTTGKAIEKVKNFLSGEKFAPVLSFFKKWGVKAVLPSVLVFIAFITLCVCFIGVRGTYVNVNDPNEFYSFTSSGYEYHGMLDGDEYVDKGKFKIGGGKLSLTYKDEDFGKQTDDYIFSRNGYDTIFISEDKDDKIEFKRVDIVNYKSTLKKARVVIDGNGGSGTKTENVKIGNKIVQPSNPTRVGYDFRGWWTTPKGYLEGKGKHVDFETYRFWQPQTIYANWRNPNAPTVSFETFGGSSVPSIEINPGSSIAAPADPTKTNLIFDGWYKDRALTTSFSFSYDKITESITLYAKWVDVLDFEETSDGGVALTEYRGSDKSVDIPRTYNGKSVTSIGNSAFYGCSGLISITIPNSVTSIGNSAFYRCSGLTSITVDTNNTTYASHQGILMNNTKTEIILVPRAIKGDIVLPNSVTSIGYDAFDGCSGLTSVTIPASVTSIGEGAFSGCSGLTTITIPNSVTRIEEYAFYGCSGLTSITIPNSVTSIGDWAFYQCSGLTSVTIPDSVKSIGRRAFYGCSGLTTITIPSSVTSISWLAFSGCSGLTTITIPSSVTSIGDWAFAGCSGLTSVTIPNSVTRIEEYAFSDCSGLTTITIPNSVTSIGYDAFDGCSGLTTINCKAASEPSGWNSSWKGNCKAIVNWGYTGA